MIIPLPWGWRNVHGSFGPRVFRFAHLSFASLRSVSGFIYSPLLGSRLGVIIGQDGAIRLRALLELRRCWASMHSAVSRSRV